MILPILKPFIIRTKPIVPGSTSYTSPGTYSLTVPAHRTITFDPRGGSGGGGGAGGLDAGNMNPGGDGTSGGYSQVYYAPNSSLLNAIGYGGGGGGGERNSGGVWSGTNGASGTASGGDSNITGGGAAGGSAGYMRNTNNGLIFYAGAGGSGGRAVRTLNRGILVPGQTLTIIVGNRGAPGGNGYNTTAVNEQHSAGYGNYGAVYISWT